MQFNAAPALVELGAKEAEALAGELARWSLSEEDWAVYRGGRHRLAAPAEDLVLGFVRVEGNRRVDSRAIQAKLHVAPGGHLDLEQLADDVRAIYGMGDFEQVTHELRREGDQTGVVLHVQEKAWGPNYLRFGLVVDSDFEGETGLSLLANYTLTRLNALGGEWRNDLVVGGDRILVSEFYQPLSFRDTWFVAPGVASERRRLSVFALDEPVAEVDSRTSYAGLDLGYQHGRYAEYRIGARYGRVSVERATGVPPPELVPLLGEEIGYGGAGARFATDRLDSAAIPRRGGRAQLIGYWSLESFGADDEYTQIVLDASKAFSRGPHRIYGSLSGGVSPGGELPYYARFRIGGPGSFAGYARGELSGDAYGIVRLGYFHTVSRLPTTIGRDVVAGLFAEVGDVWQDDADATASDLRTAYTALLGADTSFGPLYFGVGWAEEGSTQVFLSLGRTY